MINYIKTRKLKAGVSIKQLPTGIYTRFQQYKKLMGHLSSVYCVCFDQTGQFIFTGADDHLIKIWDARTGRLLKTLRGHHGEITDMSVNYENRLLASGSMDRITRIWDLKTSKLLHCLNGHTAMVTSVRFAPYNRYGNDRYLITTSNDGSVVFWSYHVNTLDFKRVKKFKERNRPGGRIVCSSFSTGGSFLACGSSDNYIHVYGFHPDWGPYWFKELGYHSDQVDSIQFSNKGFRFITGSQDGTAVIWKFKNNDWQPLKLDMNTQEDQRIVPPTNKKVKPKVLIVQWSRDDRYVMTSVVDNSIRVWDSQTGKLIHRLVKHDHDIYLIESHPFDARIFISAGHDGRLIIWDIETGEIILKFENKVNSYETEGTCSASIYDTKFSPDGNMIAITDSYGYLTLFGNASPHPYQDLPEQMFFHTDYRALIRDMRNFVMDEQTHIAPHLMPRPLLVDMNGYPYPDNYQRLVPDYRNGERTVIAPLSENQVNWMAKVIACHSKLEDEEFINEKRDRDDELAYKSESSSSISCEKSRYNTRYSTRQSFRSARNNFMPRSRRSKPRVRYYEEDDEEEAMDDEDTEEDISNAETEIEDDNTVIDSEATDIYENW